MSVQVGDVWRIEFVKSGCGGRYEITGIKDGLVQIVAVSYGARHRRWYSSKKIIMKRKL